MPIEFKCQHCSQVLRVPETAAGKQAKCPECGSIQDVPNSFGTSSEVANPFTAPLPPSAPPSEFNPYQSPETPAGIPLPPVQSVDVQSQVTGPAIALIVVGGIGLALQVLNMVAGVFQMTVIPQLAEAPPEMPFQIAFTGVAVVMYGIAILVAGVIIYGGLKMKNLESYPWAMAASIVAMVPCISPCCFLGLPIGIWCVVVLSNPLVRDAFPRN